MTNICFKLSNDNFFTHLMPLPNSQQKQLRKSLRFRAVVVAQLVEWPRPTSEVWGSNQVIGKNYIELVYCKLYLEDKK